MAAQAGLLALLVLGALTALPGAQAQITCNVPANWTETAPEIGFLGVGAACPAAESAVSVTTCGQCVCSAGSLFQVAVNTTEFFENLNSSDPGAFGLFSDFLTLCINNQASSFTDVATTEAGIQACLADSTFQSTVGGSVQGLQSYCQSRFAPSPPVGSTATPPLLGSPPVPDAIPTEESSGEESSGEESSAEASPPPFPPGTVFPPPFPPGTILPPPYPPGFVFPPSPPGVYPPGVYPPPPSPGSGATLQRATFLLQAAVALVALLCSFAFLL